MKCPKCQQVESFKADMWEVDTFSGFLDGSDLNYTKHDQSIYVAIDPQGDAKCIECEYEGPTSEFLGAEGPFPVQAMPDFGGESHVA